MGVSYPVCVLATLFVLHLLGIHLNVISLAGLALGIGMLGDNAVIVVENIRRSVERGLPAHRAVLEGAARIGVPAAVSTATNVAVFLPVLTLDGVGRQLFGQMAVAMTVSLLVSLLVATTLVPVLVDRFPWTGGIRTGSVPSGPACPLAHEVPPLGDTAEGPCRRDLRVGDGCRCGLRGIPAHGGDAGDG